MQKKGQVAEYELYKRIKLLGEGAFGKAYLVECLQDKTYWVIKQMEIKSMSPEEQKETLKEAKILEAFNHANITKFKEVYKTKKGKLCIVMEYADGGDLSNVIKKYKDAKRSLKENQILDWFVQICLAVKHVHDRKIIHRDLKGQNIFLTKNDIVKLGDFGIARVLGRTMEKAKTMVGTPYYLSPEIIEQKPYSFKTDIWSLGVILYELCALQPPFNADSLHFLALKIVRGNYSPVPSQYSRDMKNLIANLLQVNPNKRPNIQEILQKPFLQKRIQSFLTESQRKYEFSHTVLHNQKVHINPNLKMSEFKQVNQEVPCPPHLLQQQLQKKESDGEKQNPYALQKKDSQSKPNYHYKQDAWEIQREIEKKEKERQKEKELQRKKEIEQQRRVREEEIKKKELEKQVQQAKNREKEYEQMLQEKRREFLLMEQKKNEEIHQRLIEKKQQELQQQQQNQNKYQQASRDQYFSDKEQARLNKQRALQDQQGGTPVSYAGGFAQDPVPLKKKNSVQKVSKVKQSDKKKPISKKQEEDNKIEKIRQQRLLKMKENQEKKLRELEQKNKDDQEEKAKMREEKQRQYDEAREKMKNDRKRAKWNKGDGFKYEILTTHGTQPSGDDSISTQNTEQKEPEKPKKVLNKWNKKNEDIPVEIFLPENKNKKNVNQEQEQVQKQEEKQEEQEQQINSDEAIEKEKELVKKEIQHITQQIQQSQLIVEQQEKQQQSQGDDNEDIEGYYEKDDLDNSEELSDDFQRECLEQQKQNKQQNKFNSINDSFDPNDDREESDEEDFKQNTQQLKEIEEKIPEQEKKEMNQMFEELQNIVGNAAKAVNDCLPDVSESQDQNIFDFTKLGPVPNLKEREDQRLNQMKDNAKDNLGSQELSDDREDDDEEPELQLPVSGKNSSQVLTEEEKEKIKEEIKKNEEEKKKAKKNNIQQQECMEFIHSDYSKLEDLKITLEEKLGFENFIKAYGILKQQLSDTEDLNTLEQLYGNQKYYDVLPFLEKKILDDNIALLITLIIMEDNWEKKMQNF